MEEYEFTAKIASIEQRISTISQFEQMAGGQMAAVPMPQQFNQSCPTSYAVEKDGNSWRMYFPSGAYSYAGFIPSSVAPAAVNDYVPLDWIENDTGNVYAHVIVTLDSYDSSVTGVSSITFDSSPTQAAPGGHARSIDFPVAVVTNGDIKQIAFGSIREGGNASVDGGIIISGSISYVGDYRYDVYTHQLQKRIYTYNFATGLVVMGEWEMVTGGQCTPHSDEHQGG